MSAEHVILCGPAKLSSRKQAWRGAKTVRLDTDRRHGNVNLRISDISSSIVAGIPEIAADLLEVATFVYCADQAAGRGGMKELEYGQKWRRHLRFEIPVRRPEIWSQPDVQKELSATLGFLSDDDYEFVFSELLDPPALDSYFECVEDAARTFGIEEVMLFSGGLDSFGGAVKEILEDGRKVALVSHRPVSKLDARQKGLVADISDVLTDKSLAPFHVPVWINKDKQLGREHTQRSRSFLYASLGMVVARLFGLDRVRFYENGIVSMNLPLTPQAIGGRASRTTHPQVLAGFSALFSMLFERDINVENPFFWKTKTDVLEAIKAAGHSGLCARTTSCAHTWELTKLHSHCGRCSQCVDRRLVALAAGYTDEEDPAEMYKLDVLRGSRRKTEERILVESYAKTVGEIEGMSTAVEFCSRFGEVGRLINHIDGTADAVAQKVFELHKRHARQVLHGLDTAARQGVSEMRQGELPSDCLLNIVYGSRGSTAKKRLLHKFPTPEGAGWEDISIIFKDGHTVSVSVGDVQEIRNYTQMGMLNAKTGNPTKQWDLLRRFAEGNGVVTWQNSRPEEKHRKRKSLLAKNLRDVLGIEGDPFILGGDGSWHVRFTLTTENADL